MYASPGKFFFFLNFTKNKAHRLQLQNPMKQFEVWWYCSWLAKMPGNACQLLAQIHVFSTNTLISTSCVAIHQINPFHFHQSDLKSSVKINIQIGSLSTCTLYTYCSDAINPKQKLAKQKYVVSKSNAHLILWNVIHSWSSFFRNMRDGSDSQWRANKIFQSS